MSMSTAARSARSGRRDDMLSAELRLRSAALVFALAVAVHGADHLRRGVDVVTTTVLVAGGIQFLLGAITVVLIFRRHHWASRAAIVVGFASAIGFTAAHLLPHWSAFSDAFTGRHVAPNVTVLSWAAALFEIGADVALGWAGVRVLRIDRGHNIDSSSR
jgi:Na+/proline symporter